MMPPEGFQQPSEGYIMPPQEDYQQPTDQTTTTTEPQPSEPTTESSPMTGGIIANSGFLRYWFFG